MILIVLGLALWTATHVWKRVAPDHRASFGDKGKGIVAAASVAAIVLMVIGYRGADGAVFWGRTPATTGINNLMMLLAFYIYAASVRGTRITRWIRHAQLTATVIWAIAHLLVNGDTSSFVLFGGIGVWALAEMLIINRAEGPRAPYQPPALKSEIIAGVVTIVVFSLVVAIHIWLGYNPFG